MCLNTGIVKTQGIDHEGRYIFWINWKISVYHRPLIWRKPMWVFDVSMQSYEFSYRHGIDFSGKSFLASLCTKRLPRVIIRRNKTICRIDTGIELFSKILVKTWVFVTQQGLSCPRIVRIENTVKHEKPYKGFRKHNFISSWIIFYESFS